MSHTLLTDNELQHYAAEHIWYEIEMLLHIPRLTMYAQDQYLTNAVITGFAIHLRNLIEFFDPDAPRQTTDVRAADYFGDPLEWKRLQPDMPQSLLDAKKRANKEVSHLTTERIAGTPPEKSWEFMGLVEVIEPIIRKFSISADPEKLDGRFIVFRQLGLRKS